MPAWTPKNEWLGQDAFVIGGGSSLRGFDFKQFIGLHTIGANDAFRLGHDIIQFCIFGDSSWFQCAKWDLERYKGRVVCLAPSLYKARLEWLLQMERVKNGVGSGHKLGWNYSTGAAAVNLAASLGASRIFLLGFDMVVRNHESHWHNWRKKVTQEESFLRFLKGFSILEKGLKVSHPEVQVFNVTDGDSRLKCFETIPLKGFQPGQGKEMAA